MDPEKQKNSVSRSQSIKEPFKLVKAEIKKLVNFFLPQKPDFVEKDDSSIKEIRFEGRLYNVTGWVKNHPGGRVIEFYTKSGEDATEAIKQFHYRSSDRVLKLLKVFKSRPIPEEEGLVGRVNNINYEGLSEDFEKLSKEFQSEGLFEPSWPYAVLRVGEIFVLAAASALVAIFVENIFLSTGVGALILALLMLRASYLNHEAGHYSMTGRPDLDKGISGAIFALCVGLSGSWWRSHHNRHHAMPQRLQRDVNLNTMPYLAYNVEATQDEPRSAIFPFSFIIRHQAKLLVPALSLGGLLGWKFWFTPKYIWTHKQYLEFIPLAVHYVLAYFVGIYAYALATVIFAALVLITFDLSHSHLPITREPRHWVEYGLIHTINVDSSWFLDWWTGHLNFQIEHHLFPTMPNFRLARSSERIKLLAEKYHLPYVCVTYGEAVKMVFQNLHSVSKELKVQKREEAHSQNALPKV